MTKLVSYIFDIIIYATILCTISNIVHLLLYGEGL